MAEHLSWLAALGYDDQSQFFLEMSEALGEAESARDAEPLEKCLREWRTTAGALSDPQRREVLTGAGDDDYAEVARP